MKKNISGFLVLFIILTIAVSTMWLTAQAKDTAAEVKLKMIFTEMIENNKENLAKDGKTLNVIGDINIEDGGKYYAVTLPELVISEVNGDQTQIGMIAVNATPTDNPNNWNMAIALPTPFVKNDAEGTKIGQFNLGTQKFAGIYSVPLKNFTKLALDYRDLKFSNYEDNEIVDIEKFEVFSDLVETKDTLSGPTNIKLSDITFADVKKNKTTTIDEVDVLVEYEGLDILALLQNSTNLNINKLGGVKLKADIKDIESNFKLSRIEIEYDGEKPKNGLSDQKFKMKYNNLRPQLSADDTAKFIPQDMNIDFAFNKLPIADLIALGVMKATSSEDNPAAALGVIQAITTLPAKMSKSGTNLDIDNIDFKNDLFDITTKGKLKADNDSPIKIVGDIILSAKGLDKTRSAIEQKMSNSNANGKKAMAKILNQITFIKEKCDGAGGDYVCNINLSKSGQVTVNNNAINLFELISLAN